jgi:DNA adenine methylase
MYVDRINISNMDAIEFLETMVAPLKPALKPFVYLDPPYYEKGRELYLNFYEHDDHAKLAAYMAKQTRYPWVISYDNVRAINKLYSEFRRVQFSIDYSARERREGSEVMIFREGTRFPAPCKRTIPSRFISAADNAPAMPA